MMHTFIKNGFIKVKIDLNVLEKIHFYHCCELTTTQNIKNIKNFRSQLSRLVLKISAKYCPIIVIDKISEYIEISFVSISHTPSGMSF